MAADRYAGPISSAGMDYRWAEGQLREYVQAVRDCGVMQVLSKDRRKALSNLNLRLPHISDILPPHGGQTVAVRGHKQRPRTA